jgi:hypothetical protein
MAAGQVTGWGAAAERGGGHGGCGTAVAVRWPEVRSLAYRRLMCRSIKTLREPYAENVTDEDVRAAALQYVRKVSGFRNPARHNAEAFSQAVDVIASATSALLGQLEVRPSGSPGPVS